MNLRNNNIIVVQAADYAVIKMEAFRMNRNSEKNSERTNKQSRNCNRTEFAEEYEAGAERTNKNGNKQSQQNTNRSNCK